MNWFKKHWNDPITVGGYTKLTVVCWIIAMVVAAGELVWYLTDIKYKITDLWETIVHKVRRG
jgi:hypothetical protein